MYMIVEVSQYVAVASFSEAWIEMQIDALEKYCKESPPSRRRGLKSSFLPVVDRCHCVASFSEAWIEIGTVWSLASVVTCRLLLGGVD